MRKIAVHATKPAQQANVKSQTDVTLSCPLGKWRVGARLTIDDREVQPVQGTTAGGATATLCFDAESGLLVRLVRFSESPVGRIVTQVDYSDYVPRFADARHLRQLHSRLLEMMDR